MKLERVTSKHQDAILDFEIANRDYFAATVPDRGDDFFADYPAHHAELLALQDAGTDFFHLLVADDETIAGRFNLFRIEDGSADLGYRVGEAFTGRGVATAAVGEVIGLAGSDYRLSRLRAEATVENVGSCTVLLRNGFTIVGDTVLQGRLGHVFALDLTALT